MTQEARIAELERENAELRAANYRGPLTRFALARLTRLCMRLRTGGKHNCTTLAADLHVSTKTILRDIEFLRTEMRVPISYDHRTWSYSMLKEARLDWFHSGHLELQRERAELRKLLSAAA